MEPNEERQGNDKKAERLGKRRERRRQHLLEETAEEREARLEKRREAWEKRLLKRKVSKGSTTESIGNRKKLQKVPRKEKLAWKKEEKYGKKDC